MILSTLNRVPAPLTSGGTTLADLAPTQAPHGDGYNQEQADWQRQQAHFRATQAGLRQMASLLGLNRPQLLNSSASVAGGQPLTRPMQWHHALGR